MDLGFSAQLTLLFQVAVAPNSPTGHMGYPPHTICLGSEVYHCLRPLFPPLLLPLSLPIFLGLFYFYFFSSSFSCSHSLPYL